MEGGFVVSLFTDARVSGLHHSRAGRISDDMVLTEIPNGRIITFKLQFDAEMWACDWPVSSNYSRYSPPCWRAFRSASRTACGARDCGMIVGGGCVSPECFRGSKKPPIIGVRRSAFSVRCFSSMRIDIVTLFPEICRAPLSESMMKRAQENRIVDLHVHNLRDWATDKHHVVDDAPFGGGQGMVMKPEPIFAAVEDLKSKSPVTHAKRRPGFPIANRKSY